MKMTQIVNLHKWLCQFYREKKKKKQKRLKNEMIKLCLKKNFYAIIFFVVFRNCNLDTDHRHVHSVQNRCE